MGITVNIVRIKSCFNKLVLIDHLFCAFLIFSECKKPVIESQGLVLKTSKISQQVYLQQNIGKLRHQKCIQYITGFIYSNQQIFLFPYFLYLSLTFRISFYIDLEVPLNAVADFK